MHPLSTREMGPFAKGPLYSSASYTALVHFLQCRSSHYLIPYHVHTRARDGAIFPSHPLQAQTLFPSGTKHRFWELSFSFSDTNFYDNVYHIMNKQLYSGAIRLLPKNLICVLLRILVLLWSAGIIWQSVIEAKFGSRVLSEEPYPFGLLRSTVAYCGVETSYCAFHKVLQRSISEQIIPSAFSRHGPEIFWTYIWLSKHPVSCESYLGMFTQYLPLWSKEYFWVRILGSLLRKSRTLYDFLDRLFLNVRNGCLSSVEDAVKISIVGSRKLTRLIRRISSTAYQTQSSVISTPS
jgi:hypothetical protein